MGGESVGRFKSLADRSNYREVISELQYEFVVNVISNLGLPEEELEQCFPEEYSKFDVESKIRLRSLLGKFNVQIIDDKDGGLKIYVESEVIAEWKKCFIKIKTNRAAINPEDKMFVEIECEYFSVFEELKEESDG